MEALGEVSEVSQTTKERNHGPARPSPPRPPMPYSSDKESNTSISNGRTKVTKKLSNSKEKPVAPVKGPVVEGANVQLARAGETILETFYGLLYIYDGEIKDWKLAADGYIPLCFIQERGNVNKPFKVIAARGSVRLMEFPVTKDTKCTQNKAFIRWHDSPAKMYGVRFHKEEQGNQFFSAMDRMKSTLVKTAELFKQPERKAVVSQIIDPTTEGVSRAKVSLIIKLPNKETTIMTVPGLISIGELFELICKRENLDSREHQLNLPKVSGKELDYEPDTVLGSLNIREVTVAHLGGAKASHSTSTVEEEHLPSKDQQASVSSPARPLSSDLTNHTSLPMEKKASPLSQSSEQLDVSKKEPVKVKRRAPPPPQRPERPKSMPVPRPRNTESPGAGSMQVPPQAKKRQAPARPPAPKIPRDPHLNNSKTPDDRLPPEFCPPPPPDDMPPPIDECEHPVSPLSDEDLHETAWIPSSGDHNSSSPYVTSFKDEHQDVPTSDLASSLEESLDLPSPESIPLKFLLPSPEKSTEDTENVQEREGQSSRISFVGDSRSSSVDISSDIELPTSPTLNYTPPIDLQGIEADDNETEQEIPNVFSPPPMSHFSSDMKHDTTLDSADVEVSTQVGQEFEIIAPPPLDFSESENDKLRNTDIESFVVPPPPLMFEDSPDEEITKETSLDLETEVGLSILPPTGFEEEVTESSVNSNDNIELSKKKLGLNNEMFPWMSEPQPTFKAEISSGDIVNSHNKQSINMVQNEDFATEAPKNQDVEERTLEHQVPDTLVSSLRDYNTQSQVVESEDDDSVPRSDLMISTQQHHIQQQHHHHQQQQQQVVEAPKSNDVITSTSAVDEYSKESKTSKGNYQNNQTVTEMKGPIHTPEIPIPNAENSLKAHNDKRKSTSSDEGSTSFKTPFDDLGSMENSLSSSVTSEFEDDFPDLKHLKLANAEKRETSHDVMVKKDDQTRETSLISTNETTLFNETETVQISKTSKLSSLSTDTETWNNDQNRPMERVYTEPVIESSTATPVAIPVDILFQTLEQTKTNPQATTIPQNSEHSQIFAQRTISGGFKTQSWADIKNQERIMEEERQRKIALDRMQQQQQQQKQQQQQQTSAFESETKYAPTTNEVKSLPSKEKKPSLADEKPLVFEEKTPAARAKPINDHTPALTAAEGISFSLKTENKPKQSEPHITKRHPPLSYVSSALERKSSSHEANSSNDNLSSFSGRNSHISQSNRPETIKHVGSQNASTVASSSHPEETPILSKQSSVEQSYSGPQSLSSSYGAQGVIMRKKASAQNEDTAQKRKSIQDMMKMFSTDDNEDQQRKDVTEEAPRQSPALRLLEERMGYRERSSSDGSLVKLRAGTTPSNSLNLIATTSDAKPPITESLGAKSSEIKPADTVPSETNVSKSNLESQSDKSLQEVSTVNTFHETTRSTSRDTDSSRIRPRTKSALTPKPYGVLFPREQKSFTKMTKNSDITVETKKEVEVLRKNSNPKAYDVLFPKEQASVELTTESSSGSNSVQSQMPKDSIVETRKQVGNKSESVVTKPQPMFEIIRHEENANETHTSVDQTYREESHPKENANKRTDTKPSQQVLPSRKQSEPVVKKPQPMFEIIRQDEYGNQKQPSGNNLVESKTKEERPTASGDHKVTNDTVQLVELRKKTSVSDPSKRHSMPVNLMTSKSTPAARGSNLKILMAPQISDVDVVPKGRVAAMKAAWKAEDV